MLEHGPLYLREDTLNFLTPLLLNAPLWSLDWPNWKAATCRQSRGKARGGHLHIHSFNCYLWCAQARSNPRWTTDNQHLRSESCRLLPHDCNLKEQEL
ncbi:uncharacterized protein LOC120703697 isoform X2 [Panicum virgatum]|uniref:uncharacterized protein LOC120703697 isoform X2 n=1 Tax=Panicum virgatum TaxID=38727 RepID=UPI0019D5A002|nr:uncharacterized protein LOC120703697 isoform X2 [Panicum virgatum]